MKKITIFLTSLLILISLYGCANPKNTISSVELTDREQRIARTANDVTYMYEYKADNNINGLRVWIEKYEYGELTRIIDSALIDLRNDSDKSLIVSIVKGSLSDQSPQRIQFVLDYGDVTSIYQDELDDNGGLGRMVQSFPAAQMPVSDNMTLMCVRYYNTEGISPLTAEFYSNPSAYLNVIQNDTVTYLLRCAFTQEVPQPKDYPIEDTLKPVDEPTEDVIESQPTDKDLGMNHQFAENTISYFFEQWNNKDQASMKSVLYLPLHNTVYDVENLVAVSLTNIEEIKDTSDFQSIWYNGNPYALAKFRVTFNIEYQNGGSAGFDNGEYVWAFYLVRANAQSDWQIIMIGV